MSDPLPILYRDERYIAVHKPAGMLVHRSPMERREATFAIQTLREQIGQRVYPLHRLDRPTSGILLFALDEEALAAGQKLFEERQVAKTYLALTRGHPPESGRIDIALAKYRDTDGRIKSEQTQEALTLYKRLETFELPYPTDRYATTRYALLEIEPQTGRRHQIRRHLAHLRYPIIGDTRHGDSKANIAARSHSEIRRLMLAATDLSFTQPFTEKPIQLHCPPVADFQAALERVRQS